MKDIQVGDRGTQHPPIVHLITRSRLRDLTSTQPMNNLNRTLFSCRSVSSPQSALEKDTILEAEKRIHRVSQARSGLTPRYFARHDRARARKSGPIATSASSSLEAGASPGGFQAAETVESFNLGAQGKPRALKREPVEVSGFHPLLAPALRVSLRLAR